MKVLDISPYYLEKMVLTMGATLDVCYPIQLILSQVGVDEESNNEKSIIIDGIGWYVYEPVCKRRLV
jgi:hypothetical protein